MSQIANSLSPQELAGDDSGALELRIFRLMIASVAVAVIASTILAPWRVTTGLMLGGGLSLFNYHWLQTSVAAVFNVSAEQRPRFKVWRFIIRYFVVAAVAFAAYELRLVSLASMLVGLCAFVPALLVEAARQFYFAIFHREEIS